jgi:hypothetical protein
MLKGRKPALETKLFTSLATEEQQNVTRDIANVSENTHDKTKWRHQQQCLESKRNRVNELDLIGTQLKRWIVNLCKYRAE